MNKLQIISSGIVKNNPTFVLVLGMCPTLGTTTSAENGMGMGLATMAVLIMSNLVISLIKNIIPDKVRIPAFIVVIASFVTIIQMLMQAYVPALYGALGVFIPLIVVNCIILGRAEAFASKNSPLDSILDGVGIANVGISSSGTAEYSRRRGHRPGLHAGADCDRRRARDPGQRRHLRRQPRLCGRRAADLRAGPGGIPGAGLSDGIV